MSKIQEMINSLGTSKPVFKAKIKQRSSDEERISVIRFELVDEHKPTISGTPLEKTISANFREEWNPYKEKMVNITSERDIRDTIQSKLSRVYSISSKLKNPKMSKNFKFLNRLFTLSVPEELIISLYNYVFNNVDDDLLFAYEVHNENFINIVEKMRLKYDRPQ